ncbi:hypothetical protein EV356DRAFT_317229 [Viridothelium virens]|uniref:Uncharacterized protein n=1 Tax=Viridothelium virens TaxID=1048519 RepID=A0A6A6H097_VIRVR|nr:hypothetical protein EV356DRAFT_317229 [Viridothelium virens]
MKNRFFIVNIYTKFNLALVLIPVVLSGLLRTIVISRIEKVKSLLTLLHIPDQAYNPGDKAEPMAERLPNPDLRALYMISGLQWLPICRVSWQYIMVKREVVISSLIAPFTCLG